jgi:hypothetical protein
MNTLLTENIYTRPYLNEIKKQCALEYAKSLTGNEFEIQIIPTSQIKKEHIEEEETQQNKKLRLDEEKTEEIDLTV